MSRFESGKVISGIVVVMFTLFRITMEEISLRPSQSRNKIDIYSTPYYTDSAYCRTLQGLTKQQIELCNQQPDTIKVAVDGLNQAVKECQHQFVGYKWNCSSLSTHAKNQYISAMMRRGYKETAFSYAISSAGVAITVARACSEGVLRICGCDNKIYKRRRPRQIMKENYKYVDDPNKQPFARTTDERLKMEEGGSFKWKGCSHNLKYGLRFSKIFLDSRETANDIHSITNKHNNQVGRMAVKLRTQTICKCHGISGSCNIKTCWRSTPNLRIIGNLLMQRFDQAVLTDPSNNRDYNRSGKFKVVHQKKQHKRTDNGGPWKKNKKKWDLSFNLLYYEKSPNFCDRNALLDVPGTTGRTCNSTNKIGPGSCSTLCCGRGYSSVRHSKVERCRCKVVNGWEVTCNICNNTSWIDVCK